MNVLKSIFAGLLLAAVLIEAPAADPQKPDPKRIDVTIAIRAGIVRGSRVRLTGSTNLPEGTQLSFAIETPGGRILAQDSGTVKEGKFSSVIFFMEHGLAAGKYVGTVTMPVAAVQPQNVRTVIGPKGENLAGKFISKEKYGGGNTAGAWISFSINRRNMEKADREYHDKRAHLIGTIKSLARQLLQELLNFKDSENFAWYGFGAGGPYNAWLKRVTEFRDTLAKELPREAQIDPQLLVVPGKLMQLGFEFMKSKGKPTTYTEAVLPDLKKAIDFGKTPKRRR